ELKDPRLRVLQFLFGGKHLVLGPFFQLPTFLGKPLGVLPLQRLDDILFALRQYGTQQRPSMPDLAIGLSAWHLEQASNNVRVDIAPIIRLGREQDVVLLVKSGEAEASCGEDT